MKSIWDCSAKANAIPTGQERLARLRSSLDFSSLVMWYLLPTAGTNGMTLGSRMQTGIFGPSNANQPRLTRMGQYSNLIKPTTKPQEKKGTFHTTQGNTQT